MQIYIILYRKQLCHVFLTFSIIPVKNTNNYDKTQELKDKRENNNILSASVRRHTHKKIIFHVLKKSKKFQASADSHNSETSYKQDKETLNSEK